MDFTPQMQAIQTRWGAEIARSASLGVAPEFLAGLVANESNGNNDAKRFEPAVLGSLWEVLLGRKAAYGSIGRHDLVTYIAGTTGNPVFVPPNLPADAFQRLDSLATSWGLTQIMGYNAFPYDNNVAFLQGPTGNLQTACKMLADFAHRWHLDMSVDHEKLFACWNCGRPDPTKTYDPEYCANGMARMTAYVALGQP